MKVKLTPVTQTKYNTTPGMGGRIDLLQRYGIDDTDVTKEYELDLDSEVILQDEKLLPYVGKSSDAEEEIEEDL